MTRGYYSSLLEFSNILFSLKEAHLMRFLFKNPVLRAASRERLVVDPLRSAAGRIVTRARIERDDDRANLYSAVGGQYNFC
jgi:hypothetical protein